MGFSNSVKTLERSGLRLHTHNHETSPIENFQHTRMYWKAPFPSMEMGDESILDNVELKIANIVKSKQVIV